MDGGPVSPVVRPDDLHPDRTQRIFIVTHGRTGSTLLAAILADCGADFAMPVPADWDARGGDLEHPEIQAAAHWLNRAYAINSEKPPFGWRRYAWAACRSHGKRRLRAILAKAQYLKCVNLDLAIYEAFRLGYRPSVLLSYRRFEDCTVSDSLNSGNSDLASFARRYNRTYRNGLLQVSTFGGCAVGFDSLIDAADESWAQPLARITGIAEDRLIEARARRLKPLAHTAVSETLDRSTRETFAAVDALRGIAIVRSAPAMRYTRAAESGTLAAKFAGD